MTVDLVCRAGGQGIDVVLLHAFPLSSTLFDRVRPGLEQACRLLTPDLRGFGSSPAGHDPPELDLMADDVAAAMHRMGVERAVVGGVSMGGYVAMAMMRRHPHRVRGLLLVDTKAAADTETARANRLKMAEAVLTEGPRVLEPMLEQLLGPTTRASRPDLVAEVRAAMGRTAPAAVAWAQRAMAARPDSYPTLAAAHVPGVVVVGEEDAISPHEEALAMARAFTPEAVVHVIPAAGHLAVLENPEACVAAFRDALHHQP